eukprot:UN04442
MAFVLQAPQQVSPLTKVYQNAVQAVANLAGVEVQVKQIGVPEVPKVAPYGILPALSTPCGATFTGAQAVKAVVNGKFHAKLNGVCPGQAVVVDELLAIVPGIVELTQALVALEKSKSTENDKINALNKLVAYVKNLNAQLVANTFLLGNNISIADVTIALALVEAFEKYFGPKKRQEISSVYRLFVTVMGQKAVKKVVPEYTVAAKDVYLMPDMAALAAKPAEKVVDPMAAVPKSSLNFDSVKKLFGLQQPFNPEFATEVWKMDPTIYESYTFYTVDFKYNADEWEKDFLCENGVNGSINRMEVGKKHSFLVLNMTKVGNNYHINGAGIFRGSPEFNNGPIPVALATVGDADEYEFTKVDVTTDEGKKKFLDAFMTETFNGNPVLKRFQLK